MTTYSYGYRPDVDGLRAVAVVSVLLFHAFPHAITGGYVGVDIFFVISGFLISSILIRETQEGRFSILRFYIRRARRIFPALLVVLLLTFLLAWFFFFPSEWRKLGAHTASGALFVSNFTLWLESGYFDSSSEFKPLLHLWSLAVEEQYYLVWPMVIYFASRWGQKALTVAAVSIGVVSLAICVVMTERNPTVAFYFPVTRFWELLIGSGLAIFHSRYRSLSLAAESLSSRAQQWADTISVIALILLLLAIVGFDAQMAFPGFVAAMPVIGAALAIAAGPHAIVNRKVLSNRLMVAIGLISYPLYLWHWPALALPRIAFGDADLPLAWRLAMLTLAVIGATLTYHFVEAPIRDRSRDAKAARDAGVLWLMLLAIGALGLLAWKNVLPANAAQSPLVRQIDAAQQDWSEVKTSHWSGQKAGKVLFVGDSHMQHYAPRIEHVMSTQQANAISTEIIATSGCTPFTGIERRHLACADFMARAYDAMLAPEVKTIVIAASWKGFTQRGDYYRVGDPQQNIIAPLTDETQWLLDAWQIQLAMLVKQGKKVVVLSSSPRGALVEPQKLIPRQWWQWHDPVLAPRSRASLKQVVTDVDARIALAVKNAGAEWLDPFDYFCGADTCAVMAEDGLPIFMDDSHLRARYVREYVTYLDRFMLE